jgi:DnaJ family protein C protein 2
LFVFHFLDPHQKDDINKKAFDKFKKEHGVASQADSAAPSERFEGKCVTVHRSGFQAT